jgi:hypothetical protein
MQTESRRPPSLYVYFLVDVEHMLTSAMRYLDDRRGKNHYWGPRRQGLYERVHSCHC